MDICSPDHLRSQRNIGKKDEYQNSDSLESNGEYSEEWASLQHSHISSLHSKELKGEIFSLSLSHLLLIPREKKKTRERHREEKEKLELISNHSFSSRAPFTMLYRLNTLLECFIYAYLFRSQVFPCNV